MIDTNSPDYLAGVAAGRRSLRLSLTATQRGKTHILFYAHPAVMTNDVVFGPYRLSIIDDMPHVETFPDPDEQY